MRLDIYLAIFIYEAISSDLGPLNSIRDVMERLLKDPLHSLIKPVITRFDALHKGRHCWIS
jgi:hypothetical protein